MTGRVINGLYMSLEQSILCEEFKMKSIIYGSQYDDGRYGILNNLRFTFFQFENIYVYVSYNTIEGEFGYGTCDVKTIDIKQFDDKLGNLTITNLLSLYNNLIYVMFRLVEELNLIYFFISIPKTHRLAEVYIHMFESKSFIKLLKDHNFKFSYNKKRLEFDRVKKGNL